jgi:hypothetical protein
VARSRPSARPVAVGAVVALAAVLSGCSATNPITTEEPYSASDGVRATLGSVTAENLLVIAAEADGPGAVQGALTNRGDDAVTVDLVLGGDSEQLRLGAGETLLLGGTEGEELVLTTPAAPGAVADLALRTAADGEIAFPVPVLDGTLPEYADLVPSEA